MRYLASVPPSSATSSERSTRCPRRSSTSSRGTASSLTTASAASSAKEPAKTESRGRTARSGSVSRSKLQSIAARSVRCLGSAVRLPPVSRRNRSSRRAAIWAGGRERTRAAASSTASGIPSSRRQICATAAPFAVVSSNAGATARARSTNRRTASHSAIAARSGGPASTSGSVIEVTGSRLSPGMPSASRLVARTWSRGHRRSSCRPSRPRTPPGARSCPGSTAARARRCPPPARR